MANWHTGAGDAIPAVGGAMDLAIGAKRVWVMMELLTKNGESKLVQHCTYPVTALTCVSRIYTDVGVFELSGDAAIAIELVDGVSLEELKQLTGLPLYGGPPENGALNKTLP